METDAVCLLVDECGIIIYYCAIKNAELQGLKSQERCSFCTGAAHGSPLPTVWGSGGMLYEETWLPEGFLIFWLLHMAFAARK